jgi:acyl-CoA thioesterase I
MATRASPAPGTLAGVLTRTPDRPLPRRALLEVKHVSVPTLLAQASVLLSMRPDGRPRRGALARRLSGVATVRAQGTGHAAHWQRLAAEAARRDGPLWVVLGDSSAHGVGALDPDRGYVGQVLRALAERDGRPWRVLNLSAAGALTRDVLADQIPRLAGIDAPDLVTCGTGSNDVLRTGPRALRAQLDAVAAALPAGSVVLTLPAGLRGLGAPYLRRINDRIRAAAGRNGLVVAEVEREFRPPWRGKFAPDGFHPNAAGYTDWAAAVWTALPAARTDRSEQLGAAQRGSVIHAAGVIGTSPCHPDAGAACGGRPLRPARTALLSPRGRARLPQWMSTGSPTSWSA